MIQDWISFLANVDQNNNIEWFHAHRSHYLKVKVEFAEFIESLLIKMLEIDPGLGILSVKDCSYRINRDIRFTKDKSPYKTWLAASFARGGKTGNKPTYYFHIDFTGKVVIAGGLYNPTKEQLINFRKLIEENPEKFISTIKNVEFKKVFGELSGEKLVNPPRGFIASTKNTELLKHKNIVAFSEYILSSADDLAVLKEVILERFELLIPMIKYLRLSV